MDFIPLLPFLCVSFPESLIIYYMTFSISRKKKSLLFTAALSLLTTLLSYLIRSVPIAFGVHSILQIAVMIIFLMLFTEITWRLAVAAVLIASIVLGLAESIFVPSLAWIFSFDLSEIISVPMLRILFTLPHLFFLLILTQFANKRQWQLSFITPLIKNNGISVKNMEKKQLKQENLLTFCLIQILMLVLLKISFDIYSSDTYSSFTFDNLIKISSVVLFAGVLATIMISNLLLKSVEREARLSEELRYVEEKHNLNLRLQVERHDFYNHLTSVYGYLKAEHYEEAKKYIQNLHKTVGNIESLLKLEPPELAALISVKLNEAKSNGVDFYWNVDIENEALPLSPEDLTHLVGNLLDNALAASKTDCSPRVDLTIVSNAIGLHLRVSNNGEVIPQNVKNNIFAAGYTTKNKGEHSGLGLHIIKEIVDSYNGHLELKEPENYPGVEFKIHIPWNI